MEYRKPINFFSYIGGKHYVAKTIVELMPPHKRYVEPFVGSGKILFAKEPSEIEVINDADKKIANLFYCVAFHFDEFWNKAKWLLHSREILNTLREKWKSEPTKLGDVEHAIATYYLFVSSFGGKSSGGLAYEFEKNSYPKMITNKILNLRTIRKRLSKVIIECKDFEELMSIWDKPDTLFYCDPPYFGAEHYYALKFTKQDHERLLNFLKQAKGKWILSGYHNELYDKALKDYPYIEKHLSKPSYGITKNSKRKTRPPATEVVWFNFEPKESFNAD